MDTILREQLKKYCDNLIDNSNDTVKLKKKRKNKSVSISKPHTNDSIQKKRKEHNLNKEYSISQPITNLKTVSPNECQTEDGFKIVSHIPSDDSDVSDAFESDMDEEVWAEDIKKNTQNEIALQKPKQEIENPLIHCKAISNLIKDFNLDKISSLSSSEQTRDSVNNDTFASKLLKSPRNVKILDYSKSRGKKGSRIDKKTVSPKDDKHEAEAYLKKAKDEIFKFGISKTEKVEKRNAKVALAISLGAKPIKKKAENYKILQKQRLEEKKKEKEGKELQRKMGMLTNKKKNAENSKKKNESTKKNSKFNDGFLRLSKQDINRINSSV